MKRAERGAFGNIPKVEMNQPFDDCGVIIDPDDLGKGLMKHAVKALIRRIPIRILEPEKQIDLMSEEEISVLLNPTKA